jgi:hypothetical protein
MPYRCHLLRRIVGGLFFIASVSSFSSDKSGAVVRWTEGERGCTFSADDDGKYRYGLWNDDFGVVIAVDAQEIEKMRRRVEPIFAVMIKVRNRGKDPITVSREGVSLEFVHHYHEKQSALDPDHLAATLQQDANAFTERTTREISKHPGKSATLEAELKDRQEDLASMQDFLQKLSLRTATLETDHPEVVGWMFFSGKSKWLGQDWKKQEQLVLRVPLGGRMVEFPFALPPSAGDLLLRRREQP